MPDPVTIGVLTAMAISNGVEQLVKTGVGEALKDAYNALKGKVSYWASGEVATLADDPTSKDKKLAVAKIIDAQSEDDKQALRTLSETLLARLKEDAPAIGLDVSRVAEMQIELGKITVTSGTGARFQDMRGGTLRTGDISVDPTKK